MKARLSFVWLAAAAFLQCADCAITTKSKGAETRELADSRPDVSTKPFVPVSEPLDERDEERGLRKIAFNIALRKEDAYSAMTNGKLMKLIESYKTFDDKLKFMKRLMEKFTVRGLTAALISARNTEYSADFAATLLNLQIESFLREGYTPAQVFEKLDIRVDSDLLLDPFMDVLENFVGHYGRGETMVSAMASVDERVLLKSIAEVKALENFRDRGLRVETALIGKWIRDHLNPRNLLEQLGISQELEALQNPCLATVAVYIRQYNNISPSNKFSLMRWFLENNNDHYALVEALIQAERNEALDRPAIELLQNDLVEIWLDEMRSMDAVFRLLKLEEDGFRVFASPKLELLKRYISLFNRENQSDQHVVTVAREHLGYGPLAILAWKEKEKGGWDAQLRLCFARLFERWKRDGIDPQSEYFSDVDADLEPTVEAIISRYDKYLSDGRVFRFRDPRRS